MVGFDIHHLQFTAEVLTPLELDEHSGAALRGNLFEAVWKRFCTNKAAPTCADCPLHTICPVSSLVAPLREENPRGRDIPRPYVITPPLEGAKCYEPGEPLVFGITLFGTIIQLLPYILLSLETFEAAGLGKRMAQQRGNRGRLTIKRVEACKPLSCQQQVIYEAGKAVVGVPRLSITEVDIKERAAGISNEQITMHFLTPMRLTDNKHLVYRPAFGPVVHRLLERFEALTESYCSYENAESSKRQQFLDSAEQIRCIGDTTYWEEVSSYSRRTNRLTPLSGFMGSATFNGELGPFRELLVWGELIRVGKNCVKGNGWYKLAN